MQHEMTHEKAKPTNPYWTVQFLSEVLIHPSPASFAGSSFASPGAAVPAVAPIENATLDSRVDRERGRHGFTPPGDQVSVRIHLCDNAIDPAVAVLTSISQDTWDVLSDRDTKPMICRRATIWRSASLHSQTINTKKLQYKLQKKNNKKKIMSISTHF